jgi:hypothetical protein
MLHSHAEDILQTVAQLISQLDDAALEQVQNLPFLEVARAISLLASPSLYEESSRS